MENIINNYATFGIDDPNVVDIVITWVNGSDPAWFKHLEEDSAKINRTITQKYTNTRFISHDEIKWALRSIEKFAPWYNMIHIVTDKQYPYWIKKIHPRIHWVDHDTLFYPGYHTYSSTALQFSFVNIPNISRRFIMMDDDCIFLNQVSISDFFDEECRTKMYTSKEIPPVKECKEIDSGSQYHYSRWITYSMMKSKFNLNKTIADDHIIIPIDMSLLFQLESQIDVTQSRFEQFRKCGSYQFLTMYIEYSYVMNRLIALTDGDHLTLFTQRHLVKLLNATQLPKLACMNFYDKKYFDEFLPSILPNKSSFEL